MHVKTLDKTLKNAHKNNYILGLTDFLHKYLRSTNFSHQQW